MPDLFILQFTFERRHVLFCSFANARKDGDVRISQVRWRRAVEVAPTEPLSILVMTLDATDEVKLIAPRDRLTSLGKGVALFSGGGHHQ
jgi:hypothetical protein